MLHKLQQITPKIKKQAIQYTNWKRILRFNLYKSNRDALDTQLINPVVRKTIKKNTETMLKHLGKCFLKLKESNTSTVRQQQLRTYPHGYYAFYVPIRKSCQFEDELMWTFTYLKTLEQKGLRNQKNLCYEQIGNCLAKGEDDLRTKARIDRNRYFARRWYICLQKYICTLDAIQKMEIYLQVLKRGTNIFKIYYERCNVKCDLHVFYFSILRSQKYFQANNFLLNQKSSTFSIGFNEQINEITMSRTLKMLYCPICQIYDCGQHDEDPCNFQRMHNFINPVNLIQPQQKIQSGIDLLVDYKALLKRKEDEKKDNLEQNQDINLTEQQINNYCGPHCYKKFKSVQQFNKFRAKHKNKSKLTPLIRNIINLGIQIHKYSPCDLWILACQKHKFIGVNCQLMFLYLVEDYNLPNRLALKLNRDEETYLKVQKSKVKKQLPQNTEEIEKKQGVKQIDSSSFYNSKISVCHHYFLNAQAMDQNCQNCLCRKRGYCRKECLCSSDCPLKHGCLCKNSQCSANRCFCFQNSRECIPGLCINCFDCEKNKKVNKCKNYAVGEGNNCLLRVGESTLKGAGLGIFAGQLIKSKQYICTYIGQLIDPSLEFIRESESQTNDFYNFGNNNGTIDSRYMGNKARFINHGNDGDDNVSSQVKLCNGTHVIVLFAKKQIKQGEQLFFNYDGNGQLFKNHKQKYPFIKKKS